MVSPDRQEATTRRAQSQDDSEDEGQRRHVYMERPSGADTRCVVCALETSQYLHQAKKLKVEDRESTKCLIKKSYIGMKKQVATCRQCNVGAHTFVVENQKFIHGHFLGRTCMEILHSPTGKEIWKISSGRKRKVWVNHKHPIVGEIRRAVIQHLLGMDNELESVE